jgi:MYND finger
MSNPGVPPPPHMRQSSGCSSDSSSDAIDTSGATCRVCDAEDNVKRCSGCKCTFYCSVAHQKQDRKQHKAFCSKVAAAVAVEEAKGAKPSAIRHRAMRVVMTPIRSSWSDGMTPAKQREWLVDCYRLRVDNDYAIGGGNMHGLYALDEDPQTVVDDFMVFCHLAVEHWVIPLDWDWPAFLQCARTLLGYAFEESDVDKKWGDVEGAGGAMASMSMRSVACMVYGFGCTDLDRDDEGLELAETLVEEWKEGELDRFVDDLGREVGEQIWCDLVDDLVMPGLVRH